MVTIMPKIYKKRRLRYDRLFIAVGLLLVIVICIILTVNSCNKEVPPSPLSSDKENMSSSEETLISYDKLGVQPDDIHNGDLLLINSFYPYVKPSDLTNIISVYDNKNSFYKVPDSNIFLDKNVIEAFNQLFADFNQQTGLDDIMITKGFTPASESPNEQSELFSGLSANLSIMSKGIYYSPVDNYKWIADNCDKYGFITRYAEDKANATGVDANSYQFRYVGTPHAYYMKKNNLCLEEYIAKLQNYKLESEQLEISCYDKTYEVYFTTASDLNEIYVPKNKEYTVSGNNYDGYIITYEK